MVNSIIESLDRSNLGSANLHAEVAETFGELANNAAYHSESEIGAFGMAQFYQREHQGRFICAVADGGIGIRESLTKNPAYKYTVHYDWTAIEYATQELVSGTGDAHRGIGLYEISNAMRHPGRELFIHSGIGLLHIETGAYQENFAYTANRTKLFPGASVLAIIES